MKLLFMILRCVIILVSNLICFKMLDVNSCTCNSQSPHFCPSSDYAFKVLYETIANLEAYWTFFDLSEHHESYMLLTTFLRGPGREFFIRHNALINVAVELLEYTTRDLPTCRYYKASYGDVLFEIALLILDQPGLNKTDHPVLVSVASEYIFSDHNKHSKPKSSVWLRLESVINLTHFDVSNAYLVRTLRTVTEYVCDHVPELISELLPISLLTSLMDLMNVETGNDYETVASAFGNCVCVIDSFLKYARDPYKTICLDLMMCHGFLDRLLSFEYASLQQDVVYDPWQVQSLISILSKHC